MKKKDLVIKHYGEGINGTIIFFQGKCKYHRYYRSILTSLSEEGFLVIGIPYHLRKMKVKLEKTLSDFNVESSKKIILMSHGNGDETVYTYHRMTKLKIDRLIISAPTRGVIHYKKTPTLVLWANKYKELIAHDIFTFAVKRANYKFIGYPNVTRYLFAGVGYSKYHDRYDKKPKKTFFDVEKYNHIERDVIEDITLFINERRVKEKLAIFSENYLPFNCGVNILTHGLKMELEKVGKKVYPVTIALKGVDYQAYNQDKNVVVFKGHKLPGKYSEKEALLASWRILHNMKRLRAYQFDYIQLQTEFTISLAALWLHKLDNIPMMYTAHTMWNDMMNKRYPKIVAMFINFFLNKFMLLPPLKEADIMTVPTEKVKKYYMEVWKKKEPIVVIPGCVDDKNFILNEEDKPTLEKMRDLYQLKDKKVIGFVGRVSKEKSVNQVVDYFEKLAPELPNLVLMIIGDGPYIDDLNRRIRHSSVGDRIILTGGVENNMLKYYYRLLDVFCTASTFETQGLTYIESMWCDTPILAREDHCLDHFLTNEVNGLTFTDYESWKQGLFRLLNDKELLEKISIEAHKTALTYAKEVWAKKMYYLYTQSKLFNQGKITEIDYNEFRNIK